MTQVVRTFCLTLSALFITFVCVSCDSNIEVGKATSEKVSLDAPMILESNQSDTADSVSIEELEQQLSPLKKRIQSLEDELEKAQEAAMSMADKKESELFDKDVTEEKLRNLQDENQELSNQLTAQEDTIKQLEDELEQMNIQHQAELAKQTISEPTD